jgi:hypothetical protein
VGYAGWVGDGDHESPGVIQPTFSRNASIDSCGEFSNRAPFLHVEARGTLLRMNGLHLLAAGGQGPIAAALGQSSSGHSASLS